MKEPACKGEGIRQKAVKQSNFSLLPFAFSLFSCVLQQPLGRGSDSSILSVRSGCRASSRTVAQPILRR